MATRKALGWIPGGWAAIDPVTELSVACSTPLWHLLGLMGGRIDPIRSIDRSCQALVHIYFIPTVLLNLHLHQDPNPDLLVTRRRWPKVSCVENRNLTSAENLKLASARKPTLNSSILVAYPPSQTRWMSNPRGSFPTLVVLRGGWRSAVKNIQHIWCLQTKK